MKDPDCSRGSGVSEHTLMTADEVDWGEVGR